jgi:hypothetical protein
MPLSPIENLLRQILSEDEETAYMAVAHKAMEWMAAGFVTEANQLLQTLWSFNIPHTSSLRLGDESFMVMWEVSGQYPAGIPFEQKDIDQVEMENWDSNIKPDPMFITELNYYFFNLENETYDNSVNPDRVLKAIEKYLKEGNPDYLAYGQATATAALVAARSNNPSKAEHFIRLWGQGYVNFQDNYGLWNLMRDRLTARLLLNGILAPVLGFTKEICQQQIQLISAKLSERMQHGRTLAYGELTWQQLLYKISDLAISQETAKFSDEIKTKNYLGKPPATTDAISEAEKRLQVPLPEDYKQFLLTSNGFECYANNGVTLLPIEQVNYFMNVDSPQVQARINDPKIYNTRFASRLTDSIIIGGIVETQQLLLIPLGRQQLECWFLPQWELDERLYPGFRFYMEEELQKLEKGEYDTTPDD